MAGPADFGNFADVTEKFTTNYVDFTSNLITSTFDALIDANYQQMQAYTEMVGILTKGLSNYINETKNEVAGEEILDYLEELPLKEAGVLTQNDTMLGLNADGQITEVDATGAEKQNSAAFITNLGDKLFNPSASGEVNALAKIKEKLPIALDVLGGGAFKGLKDIFVQTSTGGTETYSPPAITATSEIDNAKAKIYEAVAQRISANKYVLLQNMTELGLLRIVVRNGIIQSNLNLSFRSFELNDYKTKNKVRDKRKEVVKTKEKNVKSFNLGIFRKKDKYKMKSKTKHTHLEVHTDKSHNRTTDSAKANISGYVKLEFQTDYKPLLDNPN